MARLLAFIVLLIPGLIAAWGIKLMRDTLFGILLPAIPFGWLQFLIGFLMLAAGIGFFAGFLLRRDRRTGRVQERFKQK